MIKNLAIGSGSNRLLLISALVLGLLCAVLVGVYLSSLDSSSGTTTSTATVPVVVATQDIPAATVVTADMVTVKAVPSDLALVGAFGETTAAVGQTTQVLVALGEQITPAKVTSADTAVSQFGNNTPLSLVIPAGMRAMGVEVSDVAGAGGLVRAGDHVDLLHETSSGSTSDSGSTTTATSCYVLQDVTVLAVGTALAKPDADSSAAAIAAGTTSNGVKTVTVAVSPQDAAVLAAAQQSPSGGNVSTPLWLALRPFGEHGAAPNVESCGISPAPGA